MTVRYLDRRFQIWEYKPGHGSLLLRSPKGEQHENNIDLVFVGVEYLALPHALDGLSLEPASDRDLERLERSFAEVERSKVVVISSGGKRYHVVALAYDVSENDGDIFSSRF